MTTHRCQTPLSYERFLSYWFGDLAEAEQQSAEFLLASCPRCGELGEVWAHETQAFGEIARLLPRPCLSAAEVRALGERALVVDVPASGEVVVPRSPAAVHVFRVALDREPFAGLERLDVEYLQADHAEPVFYVSDVPLSTESAVLHLACDGHILAARGSATMRFVGTRGGERRTILESRLFLE